jgi:hypothetical protein
MKFFTALAFTVAAASANPFAPKTKTELAKANYINKLVRGAVPTKNSQLRRLAEAAYEIDISGYSVKFEQCQFVKSYNQELAETEGSGTVLATMRFVLFRLCPTTNSTNACSACSTGYGEYLVDLESYLDSTVEYFSAYQEEMCNTCQQNCYNAAQGDDAAAAAAQGDDAAAAAQGDDAAAANNGGRRLGQNKFYNIQVNCTTCLDECEKIANMANNGYTDATEFLQCTKIFDADNDDTNNLYAGPICASNGSKIKIGVFKDQYCMFLDASKEVDDYLKDNNGNAMHLSHALLKSTYTDTCISCKEQVEQNENAEGDANEDADEVVEMCEQLYEEAAKCEKSHGFANGYASYYGYENQVAEEEVVCEYMQSLKSGTYDEQGEIIVTGSSSSRRSGKSTTGGQKFALTFFILGTVGLAVYAAMLHSKLVKGGKSDLASSGGAMA